MDGLLDAYGRIGECIPSLTNLETVIMCCPQIYKAVEHVCMDILDFHSHAVRFFSMRREYLDMS
jgi:hypothetical protein